jgi:hypothetical protein
LYPLSQKAVITLSALDFLFATYCGKASRRRIGRQTNSRPHDNSIGGSSSFERLKNGVPREARLADTDVRYATYLLDSPQKAILKNGIEDGASKTLQGRSGREDRTRPRS